MSVASTLSRPGAGQASARTNRPQGVGAQRQRVSTRALTRNPQQPHVNVNEAERVLSTVGGGALAVYGLSRGSLEGLFLAALGGCFVYRGLSGHCNFYGALGVSTAGREGPFTSVPAGHGVKVEKTVTINRPAEDLYRYWRNFENLPRFMRHLESVTVNGDRSHWVAKAPLGMSVEWDAEVYTDRRGEVISWRSLDGSEVDTAGSVHFTPVQGGRATEVRVVLKYDPPAGKVGAALARWLGEAPEQQIEEDLHEFQRLMGAGSGAANTQGAAMR